MRIREASASDLPAVLELERACFGPAAWTAAMFEAELGRVDGAFLVGEAGGELLGHAVGRATADEGEVLEIGVSPAHRRQGAGVALLEALHTRLRALGARVCWLEVRADNAPAQALYRRLGYDRVGHRPRYYPDGQDATIMACDLTVRAASQPTISC